MSEEKDITLFKQFLTTFRALMTIVLKRPSLRSKQKCLFRSFGSSQEIRLFCAPRFPLGAIVVVPASSSLKDKVEVTKTFFHILGMNWFLPDYGWGEPIQSNKGINIPYLVICVWKGGWHQQGMSQHYELFLPSLESLQAPLIWRTKSFLILQAAHSLSSSSTSLNRNLASRWNG